MRGIELNFGIEKAITIKITAPKNGFIEKKIFQMMRNLGAKISRMEKF